MSIGTPPRFRLDPAWFDAIAIRASRRRFDRNPVRAEALARIGATCRTVSDAAEGGVRAVLVETAPDGVFRGLIGSYGKAVSGAPAFAAFVGGPDWHVDLGFVGEAVILEATAAGVDTCWIAGSFRPAAAAAYVDLAEGEQVRAVTPLGYGTKDVRGFERVLNTVVRPRGRLDLDAIAPGADAWPAWAREAAEAVRLAPSGKNRQPWRLRMDDGSLVLALTTDRTYWTAPIDCGIAALHAELGALHVGVTGTWQRLAAPGIARFTPVRRLCPAAT